MDRKEHYEKSFVEQNRFTAYLRVSLIRTRNKYLTEKKQWQSFEIPWDSDFEDHQHDEGDLLRFLSVKDQISSVQISKVLEDLTDQEYAALCLHIFEGWTFQDIAHLQDCSLDTVKKRYYAAIKGIKSAIEDEGLTLIR